MKSLPIEKRIREWVKTNPHDREACIKMLRQLSAIRREFKGDKRRELEDVVEATFSRHIGIRKSTKRSVAALDKMKKRKIRHAIQLHSALAECWSPKGIKAKA